MAWYVARRREGPKLGHATWRRTACRRAAAARKRRRRVAHGGGRGREKGESEGADEWADPEGGAQLQREREEGREGDRWGTGR
jgi:hypothetical protein